MKLEFSHQCSQLIIPTKCNFLDRFSTNPQISNFMKMPPLGVEFFHTDRWTDRQTDMTKLTVVFLSFANVPKN